MMDPYSRVDLTRDRKAMLLQSWWQFLRFLLKKPRLELALLVMLLICMCHLRSDKNWTPKMTKNGKISVVGYTFGHSENVTPLISSACFQTRIFVFILRQRKSQHEIVLHCQPASPMDGQMDMQSLHKYTLT